jgi:hypothetical protein
MYSSETGIHPQYYMVLVSKESDDRHRKFRLNTEVDLDVNRSGAHVLDMKWYAILVNM